MKTKIMILVLLLLGGITGASYAQQSTPEPDHAGHLFEYCAGLKAGEPITDPRICVQDRWNNPILICEEEPGGGGRGKTMFSTGNMAPRPLNSVNCGNGFTLIFQDCLTGTGQGFDDNSVSPCTGGITLGEERRNTVCAVFDYISTVIDMGSVNVEIYFPLSEFDGTGPLAAASPYLPTSMPAGTPVAGFVRDHIVNQSDPNTLVYDGQITMDFGARNVNGLMVPIFNCQSCPGSDLDLYSIILHEATHMLGFFSFIEPGGLSSISGNASGPFSLFDEYVLDGGGGNVINGAGTFVGNPADLTNDAMDYFATGNTQNEPVFSPTTWNPGSSMSHFDASRSNFNYVMRNATNGGDDRRWTMPEIEVLANLGYTILPGVFNSMGTTFNNYPIGNNDVGYSTPQNTQICVPALSNDVDADGPWPTTYGSCGSGCASTPAQVTLMMGSGTVGIVGNDICFTPTPGFSGQVVIKYCPTDGEYNTSLVNTDNCTFIYITVAGPCSGDPCNLVCNGDFESRSDNCAVQFNFSTFGACPSNFIANWCSTIGTPDIMVRGCPANSNPANFFDIPNNLWAGWSPGPGTDVWDAPNPSNNTYIGMWQTINASPPNSAEGIVIELSQPLDPTKNYTLSFYASCKFQGTSSTPGELVVGLTNGAPAAPTAGSNTTMQYYPAGPGTAFTDFVVPTTAQNVLGVWTLFTFTFSPSVAGLDHLIFEPSLANTGSYSNYLFLDEVSLRLNEPALQVVKTVNNPNPLPGDLIDYTIIVSNTDPSLTATNINVQDILPPGLIYQPGGSNNNLPPNDHNIPVLSPMTSAAPITIQALVDPSIPICTPVTNCAYVTNGNNCASTNNCVDIIVPGADLNVTKVATTGPGPYSVGNTITYEITVTNPGNCDVNNVVLEDIIPTGVFQTSASVSGPGTWSPPFLSIPTLPALSSTVLTINTQMTSLAPCNNMTNCAEIISMDEPDPNVSNNSDCITVTTTGGTGPNWPIHPWGTATEEAHGITLDGQDMYVTGFFDDVINYGGGNMTSLGSRDAYVVKYDACGIQWQHSVGATSTNEQGIAVAVNPNNGRVYACGNFDAAFNYQSFPLSGGGCWVVELDQNSGIALWAQSIPNFKVEDITVDSGTGDVAIVGDVSGPFSFNGAPFTSLGANDLGVAVYNAGGTELWADTYGGPGPDGGRGLTYHSTGRLYACGFTGDLPSGPFGPTPAQHLGGTDVFVCYWSPGPIRSGAVFYGDADNESAQDIDVDVMNNSLVIVGDFRNNLPFVASALTSFGGQDAFIANLGLGLADNWSMNLGGAGAFDYGKAVDVEAGTALASGGFLGTANFPGFPNATMTSAGISDTWVVSVDVATGGGINNLQTVAASGSWATNFDIVQDGGNVGFVAGQFNSTVTFGTNTRFAFGTGPDAWIGRADGLPGGSFFKMNNQGDPVAEDLNDLQLRLFPNPSTGRVTLQRLSGDAETVKLTLVDAQGREKVVTERGVFDAAGELEIDLSPQAQGLYFLRMDTGSEILTEKLILMRE